MQSIYFTFVFLSFFNPVPPSSSLVSHWSFFFFYTVPTSSSLISLIFLFVYASPPSPSLLWFSLLLLPRSSVSIILSFWSFLILLCSSTSRTLLSCLSPLLPCTPFCITLTFISGLSYPETILPFNPHHSSLLCPSPSPITLLFGLPLLLSSTVFSIAPISCCPLLAFLFFVIFPVILS